MFGKEEPLNLKPTLNRNYRETDSSKLGKSATERERESKRNEYVQLQTMNVENKTLLKLLFTHSLTNSSLTLYICTRKYANQQNSFKLLFYSYVCSILVRIIRACLTGVRVIKSSFLPLMVCFKKVLSRNVFIIPPCEQNH